MNRQDLARQDLQPRENQPRQNPCAQCGKPIARPDWVEHSEGRTSYLWNCRACNYRFEAIAIYQSTQLAA
jgi:hypothetical protein